jgi:hypothetical protein
MSRRLGLKEFLLTVSLLALAGCGGGGPTVVPNPQNTPQPPAGYSAMPTGYPAMPTGYPVMPTGYPAGAGYPGEPTVAAATPNAMPARAGAEADPMIALVKQDLAQRLSVSIDQISVISAVTTEWPDASLGCPKAGLVYAQIVTPGYRITLEQAQKQYDYHTGLKGLFVLCAP